jgi:sugar phosphate isomerase/epimerase
MRLKHGLHLAYCTNIHRGESWPETFQALEQYTLRVRDRVCPGKPYAIGLRLSDQASRELSEGGALLEFQRWLERENCYVFTINGFPFGRFHGARVKEQVYRPDWTSPERVAYTNRLFDLLAKLLPSDVNGSVSTAPGSFKAFVKGESDLAAIRANVFKCVEYAAKIFEQTGRRVELALEPEPLCLLETTDECVGFFEAIRAEHRGDARIDEFLGVNYDACHLAVEFEDAATGLKKLEANGIRIGKIHVSSALKLKPTAKALGALKEFEENTYLHQVVVRREDGGLVRHIDLGDALKWAQTESPGEEWRVHFHVPLHCPAGEWFETTADHARGVLEFLKEKPGICLHLEMETYTWEVMPAALKSRDVIDQLASEYEWCVGELGAI